jgi:hypothetical protein
MGRKNIVIISRTLMPSQAPRSQRTTELAKEFARLGHDVTVYAVLGNHDYSKFEKTYNLKVRNIGAMQFATSNSDGVHSGRANLFKSVYLKLLRKLIEYPDIELSFKVAQVLRELKYIDLLITIAVPHPIHWGAAYASNWFQQNNINTWVADCGDPYMGNKLTKRLFYFKFIEKWFFRKVDYVTIPIEEAKKGYYNEFENKIKVIPQGFNKPITFIYAGVFYKGIRDPRPFLDYLCELDIDFKFIVYTKSDILISKYKSHLKDKLDIQEYIPRLELLKVMSQADFLINFENNTDVQSPSKLIDYALSKRPILSVNSFQINKDVIDQFLTRDYSHQLIVRNLEQYNITNVVNKFIKLIE